MDRDLLDDPRGSGQRADDNGGDVLARQAARAYRPARVEIDEALRHGWLELWFQPKLDLRTRQVVGAEALARIRHPELGVMLPRSFLPSISEANVTLLTQHAIMTALRNWSAFDEAGFNLRISVNLPINVLLHFPIAAFIEKHRPTASHWPGLMLEVKHDQIVLDLDAAQRMAARLKPYGVSISIDNFTGTGYAAFAHLRALEFAELKIDHGFVRACANDPTNAVVCHTAIDFAHRFRLTTVAEGIETGADLQALQRMGCDFGQGVLMAPPLPMDGFLDLLHQRVTKPAPAPVPGMDVYGAPGDRKLSINRVC
jgi:EAL domain-containing protein (putative c-di-GMP-specific phosphodiesterase class I)